MTTTPLYILSLDWRQAFDSLDHTAMLEALRRFGLSDKMIAAVAAIYEAPTLPEASKTTPPRVRFMQG